MKSANGFRIVGLAAVLFFMTVGHRAFAGESVVTPEMVGHWEANAHIIVNWTKQTNLPVAVDIAADGNVTGKIGDATLKNGRFKSNRGWLGRKLNIKTDYIIQGDLEGSVIAAEDIKRSGVNMPLTFENGGFRGCVHTTGWHIGGKKNMVLTAGFKRLTRSAGP